MMLASRRVGVVSGGKAIPPRSGRGLGMNVVSNKNADVAEDVRDPRVHDRSPEHTVVSAPVCRTLVSEGGRHSVPAPGPEGPPAN